jgi:enterochelin esterase-like enzyme
LTGGLHRRNRRALPLPHEEPGQGIDPRRQPGAVQLLLHCDRVEAEPLRIVRKLLYTTSELRARPLVLLRDGEALRDRLPLSSRLL